MTRAGIFIGVDRTGGLTPLRDAARGARRMHDWALSQGMTPATGTCLVTDDEGDPVTPERIFRAVLRVLDGAGVDQLVVYFAGHGINRNHNEHWLLSEAPRNPNAAVDVTSSGVLARYCGIPHVVIVSDACRVAPASIQADAVRGQDIFPNEGGGQESLPVDRLFACVLGGTAAEIKDAAAAAGGYTALYTQALLDGVAGRSPTVLEPGADDDGSSYVRIRALHSYLKEELPRRVRQHQLVGTVNQVPDAIVESANGWLSRLAPAPAPDERRGGVVLAGGSVSVGHLTVGGAAGRDVINVRGAAPRGPLDEPGLTDLARFLVEAAVTGDRASLAIARHVLETLRTPGAPELARTVARLAAPTPPDLPPGDGHSVVAVRGRRLRGHLVPRAGRLRVADDHLLVLEGIEPSGTSALLEFDHGAGTVLALLPGFSTTLTFEDDGQLVDVAWEPLPGSRHQPAWAGDRDRLRLLRAVTAAVSHHVRLGVDRFLGDDLVHALQVGDGADPAVAVLAAYALHEVQLGGLLTITGHLLATGPGVRLLDVELLRGRLRALPRAGAGVVPLLPMRAQGWGLLRALGVRLPAALRLPAETLLDSPWSLYPAEALPAVRSVLTSRPREAR